MCLYIKSGCKIEIAKEPIVCFKRIKTDYFWFFRHYFISYFRFTEHRFNKVLIGPEHLEISNDNEASIIEVGFHAYTKNKSNPGLSMFVDIFDNPLKYAVIPEGAEYCLGEYDEIVANKMIVFSNEKKLNRYMNKNKKE